MYYFDESSVEFLRMMRQAIEERLQDPDQSNYVIQWDRSESLNELAQLDQEITKREEKCEK